MPSTPPQGDPAPSDGSLPDHALAELSERAFGLYIHVPYCAHRCGYCDFNTYVDTEGAAARYADAAIAELQLAGKVLGEPSRASTVFVGGGTPTLLPAADLARMLDAARSEFGLADDVEITVEANPETLDRRYLDALVEAGVTRLSIGMQSAVPHILATLERNHTPGKPEQCVVDARAAGIGQVSLDLIFGTPGETEADWQRSLDAALAAAPDHISAYSLIVESGTRLAAQVARGDLAAPDEDDLATKYEIADAALGRAGLTWYEISNWSRDEQSRCRHNLLYWRSHHWWGIGPGAHSHVGGVRWWNVRLPAEHAAAVHAGRSPAQAREVLGDDVRRVERILLGVRLADGHPVTDLEPRGRAAAARFAAGGLLDVTALAAGQVVLTSKARLLADALIRDLVE